MKNRVSVTITIPQEVNDLLNWYIKYDPEFKGNKSKVVSHFFTKGINAVGMPGSSNQDEPIRFDASQYTVEDGLTNALEHFYNKSFRPDICIMHPSSCASLITNLGTKIQYVQVKNGLEIHTGIRFLAAYGTLTILADSSCPLQIAYLHTELRSDHYKGYIATNAEGIITLST